MSGADFRWFLAQLKPNSARIALTNLQRQSFETFLPLEERTVSRAGKFITRCDPLFPGYIFVALDPTKGDWRKVNATRGITKLVSLRDGPTPVPTEIVDQLRDRCDAEGKLATHAALAVGENVTIKSGPFADATAEILQIDPDRRVWVLMDIMGRQARTAIDPDKLQR